MRKQRRSRIDHILSSNTDVLRSQSVFCQNLLVAIGLLVAAVTYAKIQIDVKKDRLVSEKANAKLAEVNSRLEASQEKLNQLEVRNVYRPLANEVKAASVAYFRDLARPFTGKPLSVTIEIMGHSNNRSLIRKELIEILEAAGIKSGGDSFNISFGQESIPPARVRCSADSSNVAVALTFGFTKLLRFLFDGHDEHSFPTSIDPRLPMHAFVLEINGEPEFSSDGTFELK